MTTFQAVLHAILHGFAFIQPASETAHHRAVAELLSWPIPASPALGAMAAGTAFALFLSYRHEWASVISSILRVILLRKRPMTFDERVPFFLLLSSLPPLAGLYWGRDAANSWNWEMSPWVMLLFWMFPAVLFYLGEDHSKRNRGLLDWNWIDSTGLGIAFLLGFLPGIGFSAILFLWALLRNFGREGSVRFLPYALFPIAAVTAWLDLRNLDFSMPEAAPGMSWMTFAVAALVSLFAALLAIGALLRSAERGTTRGTIGYRILVPILVALVLWFERR